MKSTIPINKNIQLNNYTNPYTTFKKSTHEMGEDIAQYCCSNTVIAIGSSTGGIQALETIISKLPGDMPPIVIVQHLPKAHTNSFATRLNALSTLLVSEAKDQEPLQNGHVYIAPGDRHMALKKVKDHYIIVLDDGPKVNYHKPSVEVLFNSMAEVVKQDGVGIILTGMGADGAQGLKTMRDTGAYTIAQDEATSTVFGMPRRAIALGAAKETLSLYDIGSNLVTFIKHQTRISEKAI